MPLRNKICVYKNCDSKQSTNSKENGIVFFRFPKNPKRRNLWMDLANVPPQTPENLLFLCSNHFDRKFMSITQRRTTLVGFAVPYLYVRTAQNETHSSHLKDLGSPKKTKDAEIEVLSHIPISDDNKFQIVLLEEPDDTYEDEDDNDSIVSLEVSASLEYADSHDDAVIDKQHVSQFLYDGEFYVKMKLDYYISEKKALLNQLKKYEQIISKIRNDIQIIGKK